MNEETGGSPNDTGESKDRGGGPNLVLIYGLIALALVAAIVIAAFVVLPFYHRR
jgi:hypothetical protein